MISETYKAEIAFILKCHPNNIFLYWKGRIALYAFLKSLKLQNEDEVIIPAFTCVVVPNAIMYAGLKPVYVDISNKTYDMDITLIEKSITTRTKVIICQNTFGLSSNILEILNLAKKYNLFTIEDCTHGFGGYYEGKPNGSYCDAAFYSTQWNKPFSTGIGGFLVINNNKLLDNLKTLEQEKVKPSFQEKIVLLLLLIFRHLFVNRFTQSILVNFYRLLSNNNLIVGSNQGSELNSTKMPKNYFKDISFVQVFVGNIRLKRLKHINLIRKKNAKDYTAILKKNNKSYVYESLEENHLFLKYPLIVKDRTQFFEIAVKQRVIIGDWFLSPLHPITGNLDKWGFYNECYPIAGVVSKKIVNLPTEVKDNSVIISFLKNNMSLIE